MKIVVFGATGGTGRLLLRGAVGRGHVVTAFVRQRARLEAIDGVRVVDGDATDPRAVRAAVAGQDAVLLALGPRTIGANPLLEIAGANLVAAMRDAGVARMIVLGAAGALHDSGAHLSAFTRAGFALFKATILRFPMGMQARLQQIVETSELDYTIVLPPRLLDGGRVGAYRVRLDGLPPGGLRLNRADLADFMLDCLDRSVFIRQSPYIAY